MLRLHYNVLLTESMSEINYKKMRLGQKDPDLTFYYVTFSPSRSVRCETKKPPAMRVRVEGYTKKLQTRYNKGVQANCKAKGEKYGTKGT